MKRLLLLLLGLVFSSQVFAQTSLLSQEVLAQSIAYHDPAGQWATFSHTLHFEEGRPDGTMRTVHVSLNVPHESFAYEMQTDSLHLIRRFQDGACSAKLNGSADFTEAEAKKHRLTCKSIKNYWGYYLYLWGLPMKLQDAGTHLDPQAKKTTFQGQEVLSIRVTYDEAVGSDIWYFYFEPVTYRMVGYRFYHDESKNDGEYIVLKDEYQLGKMRVPKARSWYVNADDRFLGEDRLVGHE